MDLQALGALLLTVGGIAFIIGLFAVLAAPIGSFHDPEGRHDDWHRDSRRTPRAW